MSGGAASDTQWIGNREPAKTPVGALNKNLARRPPVCYESQGPAAAARARARVHIKRAACANLQARQLVVPEMTRGIRAVHEKNEQEISSAEACAEGKA